MKRIPVWKKAQRKERDGAGISRRHSHLLPYLGALIVFLTFVIKEGLGEHWRRFAETIDAAQYRYSARIQMRNMTQSLEEIRLETFKRDKSNPLFDKFFADDWYRGNIRKSWSDLWELDVFLDDLRIIVDKLQRPEYEERFAQLKRAEKDGQRETDFLAERFDLDDPRTPPHNAVGIVAEPPEWKYVPKKVRYFPIPTIGENVTKAGNAEKIPDEKTRMKVRAMTLVSSIDDLREDSKEFAEAILKDAEKAKRANEVLSRYAWWIMAFLFGLGWCIGLAGKVYGLPEEGRE